jgi:hypothetical protein
MKAGPYGSAFRFFALGPAESTRHGYHVKTPDIELSGVRNSLVKRTILIVGALTMLSVGAPAQNLITNGGFETGDFTGWTQVGDTSYSGVCPSNDQSESCSGRDVFDGKWMGDFGAVHYQGGVMQTVATIPGQTYQISFWLQTGYSDPPNSADITFDGQSLFSTVDMGRIPWTQMTFTRVASGSSADLDFRFYSVLDYYDLDDVSVSVVPAETPEPSTLLLLGSSALGLSWLRRVRR